MLKDESGFGVVEIVLIIIVIVALIIIFRDEIMSLVTKAFGTITEKTNDIVNT
jgi:competence protein ComGC